MSVYRVKIRWSGFTGAPGYTILHFDASTTPTQAGADAVHAAVNDFVINLVSNLPSAVTLTVEQAVEVIDQATNQLETIFTSPSKLAQKGGVAGGFSSATGACIVWETGEVKLGRRVRGRTFVVPIAASMYDLDGTLTAACLSDLQAGAAALAGGGFTFGVLSRPTIKGAADGSFHTVSSGRVSDKTAVLTSRRD